MTEKPSIGIVGNVYDRKLVRALEQRGYDVFYFPCTAPGLTFSSEEQRFLYQGQPLTTADGIERAPYIRYSDEPGAIENQQAQLMLGKMHVPDFIIDRVADGKQKHMPLLNYFARQGVALLNPPKAVLACSSKLKQAMLLKNKGVPMPESYAVPHTFEDSEAKTAIAEHFNALSEQGELVVKMEFGARGENIHFVHSAEEAFELFANAREKGQGILLQKPIEQDVAHTIRVNVVDGKVVNAVSLTARDGARVSNDGEVREIPDLPEAEGKAAIKAVKALGLKFGGVDIIEGKVLEVNNAPDLEFLCGKNDDKLLDEIVDAIMLTREKQAARSEHKSTRHQDANTPSSTTQRG